MSYRCGHGLQIRAIGGYNAKKNNCSTNVYNALLSVGLKISPEEVTTYIASYVLGTDSTNKFQTPNNLCNKLIEQKVFTPTIIKNAGNKTSQDYEDAVIDDGVKAAIKN